MIAAVLLAPGIGFAVITTPLAELARPPYRTFCISSEAMMPTLM